MARPAHARHGSEVERDPEPAWVVRVDPRNGSAGVFRDSPIVVRLSRPIDPRSLSPATLRVESEQGTVPGQTSLSPDGALIIWQAERLLTPHLRHEVVARGLTDAAGERILPHRSSFTPCELTFGDLPD